MEYRAYLKSDRWQAIRARVLKRDGGRCRSCGRRATQVHHGNYDRNTMTGADLRMLFSLCGGCHLATSFGLTGPRPMDEVTEWARALTGEKAPKRPKKGRGRRYFCRCGKLRKHNKPRCRACM